MQKTPLIYSKKEKKRFLGLHFDKKQLKIAQKCI